MSIKQKILKFLIENKERSYSINEISKKLSVDYKLVYTNIRKLSKDDSIKIEDFKNSKRCSFFNNLTSEAYLTETQRKLDFLKNKDFQVIYRKLNKINSQFILLLFGSHAKNTAAKHSDIDLLLISNKDDSIIIQNELNLLPLKIHLTSITYEEFIKMLKTKEFTVVSEAIKSNIIFLGLEDYYRLLKNAR